MVKQEDYCDAIMHDKHYLFQRDVMILCKILNLLIVCFIMIKIDYQIISIDSVKFYNDFG